MTVPQSLVAYHTSASRRMRRAAELAMYRAEMAETIDEQDTELATANEKRRLADQHHRWANLISELLLSERRKR